MTSNGAAKFNFNNFQEIKSHSSVLYNERMAILFYLLDMKNLILHKTRSIDALYDVHATLRQIYKNIRMLLRINPTSRITLNLETKDSGIYTTDIAMGVILKLIKYCEDNGFTERRIYIIIQELDNAEMLIKDVLQYHQYFVRPDFKQKPDIDGATERYKEMADKLTIEQLKEVAGRNHMIDFNSLGTERIEPERKTIMYDPVIDGPLDEYDFDNEDEDDDEYFDEDE